MRKTLLIFIFALFASSLFAQLKNFKSGYIITNQGDTVLGQIDLRTDQINQEQCTFRKNSETTHVVYKPNEIKGYYFIDDGKYYISKEIEIKGEKLNVFVEYLVKGMLNLYYFMYKDDTYYFSDNQNRYIDYDGYVKYYFFEDENGKMMPISRKPDRVEKRQDESSLIEGASYRDYVIKDNVYRGAIKAYFPNIKEVFNEADNMEFTQKSMIKIAKKYHNAVCSTGEECIVFQRKKPDYYGDVFKIAIYTGAQFTTYRGISYYETVVFFDPTYRTETYKRYLPINSYSPLIGVEMTFKNPRWTNQLGWQIDILLSMLYQNKKDLVVNGWWIHDYKTLAPTFQTGLQYIYPKYKFRPTIGAGFAYMHNFSKAINENLVGGYCYAGFDYLVKKQSALIFRFNFRGLVGSASNYRPFSDKAYQFEAKIGYAF